MSQLAIFTLQFYGMTEKEKMITGASYCVNDPELIAMRTANIGKRQGTLR